MGQHAARFLAQRGARLVAASDSRGAIAEPGGLDVDALIAHKRAGRGVAASRASADDGEDLVAVECEIWIPAARPDTLTAANVGRLRAKLVLQGANIPATPAAEEEMHARGILSLPDFVANAGGVICAAVEYHGGTQAQAFAAIEERIRTNDAEMLERARTASPPPTPGRHRDGARPDRGGDAVPAALGEAMISRRGRRTLDEALAGAPGDLGRVRSRSRTMAGHPSPAGGSGAPTATVTGPGRGSHWSAGRMSRVPRMAIGTDRAARSPPRP